MSAFIRVKEKTEGIDNAGIKCTYTWSYRYMAMCAYTCTHTQAAEEDPWNIPWGEEEEEKKKKKSKQSFSPRKHIILCKFLL